MSLPIYLKCQNCGQTEIMTTYFGSCPYCNAIRQKETWPDPDKEQRLTKEDLEDLLE